VYNLRRICKIIKPLPGRKPGRKGKEIEKMAKWNVYKRNIWTLETQIIETASDATIADRIAMRILLEQPNFVSWIEPADGWEAEAKRAAAIAEKWKSWRTANGV
jgi:hypothetical protein